MSEPRSALDGTAAERGQTIRIADRGLVGMVTLKGDLDALAAALAETTGLSLPGTWQVSLGEDGAAAVWMAPDELLLLTRYEEAGALGARLDHALSGTSHMALDVSDARVVLSLEGAGVAEVLSKGAPVDLSRFPVGAARRTHLGGIAVVFWRRGEDRWEIAAFRSFARHLFDWLARTSRQGSEVGAL